MPGNSVDSIDAHCMNHYIHGLEHVGRTYNKKTKKSGSLSLKEKLKSKYLRNKSATIQQNATLSSASKVLTVRAGETSSDTEEIVQSFDDDQRNNQGKKNKKSTILPNKKNNTKQNSDENNPEVNALNEVLSLNKDSIESPRVRTLDKDIFSSKLEFNSENKIKLMQKIKTKKKVNKIKKHLKNGIHLATNLRLESALILNLLSSEKFLSMKADDTIDFYTFA